MKIQYSKKAIKDRVKELKSTVLCRFSNNTLKELILQNHVEYETKEGLSLIRNVLLGRSSDYRLLEILERIAQSTNTKEEGQ